MKVIFSHGKESGPWGRKITKLAECATQGGFEVESIDYTATLDPDKRAKILHQQLQHESQPLILVGSSMGGYVSVVNAMQHKLKGLFLMAPALYMPGYKIQDYAIHCECEVVHGWSDDIIPVQHAIQFAHQNHATLHAIEGDHSLTAALPTVARLFEQFLARYQC